MSATLDTRLKHYEKAVAAGEPQIADQNSGAEEANLWAVTGSRCHLRARLGLGETLDEMGRVDDAIEIFQRLMQLNPEDDQGVRYLLLPRLMATNRDVEAARLLKARNDESAQWAYGRAILAFRLSGSSDASRREIQEAFRVNPHLPRVLADPEPLNTDRYVIGSPQEAIICIEELSPVLSATPGVVDWILQEHQRYQREQHRNRRQRVAPSRKKR